MASRREWIPVAVWGNAVSISAGTTAQLFSFGEADLYIPNGVDECTFLRLKGHIVIDEGAPGDTGQCGWRVRVGLDELGIAGVAIVAGDLELEDVAEEHFLDERFWFYDTTAQPSAGDHPYYYTFDTSSKRKLQLPQSLTCSFMNRTAGAMRVTPFVRGLFLFA